MPRKSIDRVLVGQYLNEDFRGGLRQVPSEQRRWFSDNWVQRSLAYLMGWKPDGTTGKLQLAADGSLKVSQVTGGAYEDYDVGSGTTTINYAANTFPYPNGISRIDIYVYTTHCHLSIMKPNGTWGDVIYLTPGWHSIDFSGIGIRFKSTALFVDAGFDYQVYW